MGTVKIQNETTVNPISLIGKEAGVCWNGDDNYNSNIKRGIDCIKSDHGRTMEYPQVYMILDGYSARVIRELYTHLAGMPTRLQSSTRYINYNDFKFVTPPSIQKNFSCYTAYEKIMNDIMDTYEYLEEKGIPKEDIANILPLGMETKVVIRTNLRQLVDMSHQRMCNRAYWEFRLLMRDIIDTLEEYSGEWAILVNELNVFKPKCEVYGYCPEKKSCGKATKKEDF